MPGGAQFSDRELLAGELPARFAPMLAELSAIDRLREERGPLEERRARAARHHRRLHALPLDLSDETPAELGSDRPEHVRWLAEAVLLWTHYVDVVGPAEVLATLRSPSLRAFPVDLPADGAARSEVRRAIQDAFSLSASEMEEIARGLETFTSNLRLKCRITRILKRELLRRGGPLPDDRLRLLERFYGTVPIRAPEVDLVMTATAILFCIPHGDGELAGVEWERRSPEERDDVRAFLGRLSRGNTAKTDRFPAFGMFERARLDPEISEELAAEIAVDPAFEGLRPAVVAETLATMVSIVPTALAEQYLVHDAWGHGWQEALCDFEWQYGKLVHVSDPLEPGSGPYFGGEDAPRLVEAFQVRRGVVTVDRPTLLRFAERDLRGRAMAGLNAVVAEMLADVVEGKLSRRSRERHELPTSSLFPRGVMKLDLTIEDVRTKVRWWRKPYVTLRDEPEARRRLASELASAGVAGEGLEEAVALAASAMAEHLAPAFRDDLEAAPRGETIDAGLIHRVVLNFVSLERELQAFVRLAERYRGKNRWLRPEACTDLLVVLLAWFYEQDRARYVWHLDELLRDPLRPSFAKLRAALGRAHAVAGSSRQERST